MHSVVQAYENITHKKYNSQSRISKFAAALLSSKKEEWNSLTMLSLILASK